MCLSYECQRISSPEIVSVFYVLSSSSYHTSGLHKYATGRLWRAFRIPLKIGIGISVYFFFFFLPWATEPVLCFDWLQKYLGLMKPKPLLSCAHWSCEEALARVWHLWRYWNNWQNKRRGSTLRVYHISCRASRPQHVIRSEWAVKCSKGPRQRQAVDKEEVGGLK